MKLYIIYSLSMLLCFSLWATSKSPLEQKNVYAAPVWTCYSSDFSLTKSYSLKVYRKKGDKRFQFLLMRTKPSEKLLLNFAENMEVIKPGFPPAKTLLSMAIFSFTVDIDHELKNKEYSAKLVFDSVESPLLLRCRN